jgi:MFS family permease
VPAPVSPLADASFRRLFFAQAISLIGAGLTTVALALLAYDLAGGDAGAVLGTALALKMAAYIVIAPIAGAVADRLPRKALLVAFDCARVAIVAVLPFVEAVWQVYLLIFLLSACTAFFTPVFQATIPDVLPDEARYTRALSLSRLAYDLEQLISPALAALILTAASYDTLFVANGGTFLISALFVLSVRLPPPPPRETTAGLWRNLSFGVRAYMATPRLRGVLLLSLAAAAAGAMVIINTVIYVRDRLGGTETDLALALAAAGAGSMVVALLLPRLLERVADRSVMLLGGGVLALGLALGLLAPGFHAMLALWFALGMGASLSQVPVGRLLRRSCRPADRPAFFAAHFALSHACWLLTYAVAGWLGALVGLMPVFAVLATVALGATLAAQRLWPGREAGALAHRHEALDHEHLHQHDEHHQHSHEGWEGPAPHRHPHRHVALHHRHPFVIDQHHRRWPA